MFDFIVAAIFAAAHPRGGDTGASDQAKAADDAAPSESAAAFTATWMRSKAKR